MNHSEPLMTFQQETRSRTRKQSVKELFPTYLVDRWFPDAPEAAPLITRGAARAELARHYVENVVAATPGAIARLFGWRKDELEAAIGGLVERGAFVTGIQVEGARGDHIAAATLLKR